MIFLAEFGLNAHEPRHTVQVTGVPEAIGIHGDVSGGTERAWAQGVEGNYLHFETDASAGEAWTSEIRRISEEPIKGMQFDVTWPEGVAFDIDAMALSPEWGAFQLSVSVKKTRTACSSSTSPAPRCPRATWCGVIRNDVNRRPPAHTP